MMWKPTNQPSSTSAAATTTPEANRPDPAPLVPLSRGGEGASEQATIGKSLVIKGEVTGSESLYIDGQVEGSINLPGNRVTVGRNGVVAANINAREIVVQGKVRGNLAASDRVEIHGEGSLTGDVVAQRIAIEDGAFFKGGIDIRKPEQKAATAETRSASPAADKTNSGAKAQPAASGASAATARA